MASTKGSKKKKKVPARVSTRREEAQVDHIHARILSEAFPTGPELAEELRVSLRTIERLIRSMKDDRLLPIEVSRKDGRAGYYYSRPVAQKMGRTINEQELITMFISDRAVSQIPVKRLQKKLGVAFDKISQLVDAGTLQILDRLQDTLHFRPFAPEEIDIELLLAVAESIIETRTTHFSYLKHLAQLPDLKKINFHCIVCAGNSWYAIGWDTEKNENRTYLLSRIRDAVVTQDKFEKMKFDLKEYLEGCFIVMKGSESHDIVVEFNAWAAPYIRNRRFVNKQKIEELPNGGVRISFWLSCLGEVEQWIRSHGANAYVVGPEPLRQRMLKAGEYYRNSYGDALEQ